MMHRGDYTIEAAAIAEPNGTCTITAEVFRGGHMVGGFYRNMAMPAGGSAQAENDAIHEAALLTNSGGRSHL